MVPTGHCGQEAPPAPVGSSEHQPHGQALWLQHFPLQFCAAGWIKSPSHSTTLVCSLSYRAESSTVPLQDSGISSAQAIASRFIHISTAHLQHRIFSALCCYLPTACCMHPAHSSPVPLTASPGVSVTSRGSPLASCCVSAHSPQPTARTCCHHCRSRSCPPFLGKELFVQRQTKLWKHHLVYGTCKLCTWCWKWETQHRVQQTQWAKPRTGEDLPSTLPDTAVCRDGHCTAHTSFSSLTAEERACSPWESCEDVLQGTTEKGGVLY